ncbi:hypothetical protein BJY01DRAFT_212285 [Aspergillus pseudoustus]|uniref:Uncharacterized protein n=1 Tax=Aspergillus pseudoustus TaxID=1810923 RepID=A0ABR4K727_9EURO
MQQSVLGALTIFYTMLAMYVTVTSYLAFYEWLYKAAVSKPWLPFSGVHALVVGDKELTNRNLVSMLSLSANQVLGESDGFSESFVHT